MLVFAPECRHLLRPEALGTKLYKSIMSPSPAYVILVAELSPFPRPQLLVASLSSLLFYKDLKSQRSQGELPQCLDIAAGAW